jgi:hypothetical protein
MKPSPQRTQVPAPSQTPPGHVAPAAALPRAAHTGPPLSHAVAPTWQGFVGVHAAPGAQGTQVPAPLQTPLGHAVPAGTLAPVTHIDAPDAQRVTPETQGLPVLHAAPSAQARQVPASSHARPSPQGVPAGALPTSVHTGTPVAQRVAATLHGVSETQVAFSRHCAHCPLPPHTALVPQAVPGGARRVKVHARRPLEQVNAARLHGCGDSQGRPSSGQAKHAPSLSHTRPSPQGVPPGRANPRTQRWLTGSQRSGARQRSPSPAQGRASLQV